MTSLAISDVGSLAEPSEMEGEQLGKYHLKRHLATGGMAEIYLAEQLGPEGFAKEIVIKRILPHLARDRNFTAMFLDEARLAANLNHPNIGQIYELGEVEGNYFIAMEFIDGASLEQVIGSGARVPADVGARIVTDVLQALDFAHESRDRDGKPLGIVHRDVTPSNVMVSIDGIVKLVDFGVAKAAKKGHKTQTGAVKGKFAYMAPEQVESQDIDCRADIFAIGIVFYELLTSKRPFGEELAAVSRILYEDPIPPHEVDPGVPESFSRVVMRALEKDVDERYPTAHSMLLDVETALRMENSYAGPRELARVIRDYRGVPQSGAARVPIVDTGVFAADRSQEILPRAPATDEANIGMLETAALATIEESRPPQHEEDSEPEAQPRPKPAATKTADVKPEGERAARLALLKRVAPFVAAAGSLVVLVAGALAFWSARETPSALVTSDPRTVVLNTSPLVIDGAEPDALFDDAGNTVVIASIPATRIYKDGQFVGWTPHQTQLNPGRHRIELAHGEERKVAEFEVVQSRLNRVQFDFESLGEKAEKAKTKRKKRGRSLRSKIRSLF